MDIVGSILLGFFDWVSINLDTITLLIFASFVGMEVIGKVPALLHTPLMSGANAISGVTVVGGIYLVRVAGFQDIVSLVLGAIAVFLGMINVVGGFAVTGRMLEKFKKSKNHAAPRSQKGGA